MSRREHLLEFRADFQGPISFKMGATLWSTVRSHVADFREYYIVKVHPWHPGYDKAEVLYKEHTGQVEWNGEFVVPCSFVRFSEEEHSLRERHEAELRKKIEEWGAS